MLRKLELIVLLLIVTGLVILNRNLSEIVTSENVEEDKIVIVLDAGHGGKDPGKVGINDVLEKDINLQIAVKVKGLLERHGFSVVMTREGDESLTGSNSTKRDDMKARVDVINNTKPDIAVSIHQNSYSDSQVSGAQVFYFSGSDEGKLYAETIQNELLRFDEENHRQAKANDNYYLLTNTKVPAVIVECGFLSNYEEAEKLAKEEYQEEISNVIVHGIESCFGN